MDLSKIIQASGLRFDYVAEKLYPANKYPYNALLRLINTKAELSQSQILTLCDLLGVSPNELLGRDAWAGCVDGATLELTRGDFTVTYTTSLGVYAIHKKTDYLGSFTAPAGISVRQFLCLVDEQIETFLT